MCKFQGSLSIIFWVENMPSPHFLYSYYGYHAFNHWNIFLDKSCLSGIYFDLFTENFFHGINSFSLTSFENVFICYLKSSVVTLFTIGLSDYYFWTFQCVLCIFFK